MSDPFVAEIRIFPFNFAPKGWAFCNGQLLPISQNTALFALIGTAYGGDGKSTFALPNMMDAAPMQSGQGSGLSQRFLGEQSGTASVTLLVSEMPAHAHTLSASNAEPVADVHTAVLPARGLWDSGAESGQLAYYTPFSGAPLVTMAAETLSLAGGNLPHNNMQPYLALNFCIALQGVFPPRP